MKYYFRVVLFSLIVAHSINFALAVPPPDFIFSIGRQVVQVFSFLVVGISVGLAFIKQFFESSAIYLKHKTLFWVALALIVIFISVTGAYAYSIHKQQSEYAKWLKESRQNSILIKTPVEKPPVITATTSPLPGLIRGPSSSTPAYLEVHPDLPESISNQDFSQIPADAYVLDAREDEEFENGRYPGSHHIRAADVIDGLWKILPTDRPIYVVCWSGIRGKEVSVFLRTKNIASQFLEKGADGWVSFGGKWDGAIKFRSVYSEQKYEIVYTTEQVKNFVSQGVILVDSRPKEKYDRKHISGSISFPIIYTPSDQIESILNQVPPGSSVITVCDDFVSCFDATIAGARFQKRGNNFLGRYNKPWDY